MLNFENIAEYLKEPLILIGFVLLIFYYLFRKMLKAQLLKKLSKESSEKITVRVFNSIILIVIVIIFLGFALQFYKEQGKSELNVGSDNIEFIDIENIDKKITSLKFNNSGNDSILLIYKSKQWDFEVPFYIEPSYLVKDLKHAISNHFELKENVKFNSYEGQSRTVLVFLANNKEIFNENLTIQAAGIKSNDIVAVRIIAEYRETDRAESDIDY